MSNEALVIKLSRDEQTWIAQLLIDTASDDMPVRIWIDEIDQAFKIKVGNGTWGPPMGTVSS